MWSRRRTTAMRSRCPLARPFRATMDNLRARVSIGGVEHFGTPTGFRGHYDMHLLTFRCSGVPGGINTKDGWAGSLGTRTVL